jgi:hypothetical protein
MADNLKLSPEAVAALDTEEQTREVENLTRRSTAPYDESMMQSLFRRLYGGLTGGGSEHYFQQKAGLPPPKETPFFSGPIAEGVGTAASFIAPQNLIARGLTGVAAQLPRTAKLVETAGASGFQEAGIAGAQGKDPIEGAKTGALLGVAPEAVVRGGGYVRYAMASPEQTVASRVFDAIGLKKYGISANRAKLREVLEKEGVSMPGALRPRDWYVDLVEARAGRSVAGRPRLQEVAERAQRALDGFSDDTLRMVGPGTQTGVQIDNAVMGQSLKTNFTTKIDEFNKRAKALYDGVFKGEIGSEEIDVTGLADNLDELLRHWGYDPNAAMQLPEASQIHNFLGDLRKGAKKIEIYGPDGEIASSRLDLQPKEISWINARLRTLSLGDKKKWNSNDLMKLDAASTIREFVSSAVDRISPEHAAGLDEARTLWGAYRTTLRHPLAKTLLESDSASVVNRLFRSPDAIASTREVMPEPMFELARQRWIANIIYQARKSTTIDDEAIEGGAKYVLSGSGMNSKLKQFGGMDSETLRAAFADAPDKLHALRQLQQVLSQADEGIRRYRGMAESPGGPEYAGLAAIVRSLFSTITFPAHLVMTSRVAKSLTSAPQVNPYLGGVAGPGKLEQPFIRGFASAGLR